MRSARVVIGIGEVETRGQLRSALEALGYQVVGEAGDVESAWHLTRRLEPELALLEAPAASSTGFEAAEAIRAGTGALVMFISEAYEPALLDRAREVGAAGFLVAPFDEAALDVALCLALDRRTERQALRRELELMKDRLEARKLINRAKAILMERHGLSEPEAFRRLQTQSMSTATPMKALAEAVILSSQVMDGIQKRSPTV
jgi:AmiR/NasT family two-component response regulator